jgi:hypothetical protein
MTTTTRKPRAATSDRKPRAKKIKGIQFIELDNVTAQQLHNTIASAVGEGVDSAQQRRAAKEAALAPCLAEVELKAAEALETPYVQRLREHTPASQTLAGAYLDELCAKHAIPENIPENSGFVIEACDDVPAEFAPKICGRARVNTEYTFWDKLLSTKQANPDKFVSVFIPYRGNAKEEEKKLRAAMHYANTKLPADAGMKFVVKINVVNQADMPGMRVAVFAEQYEPRYRPKRNPVAGQPLACLTKAAVLVYNALVEAKYPTQVNEPAGMSGVFYQVKHATVNVSGIPRGVKLKALAELQEAGLFSYGNGVVGEIKIV